jgi:hypothetical protein
MRVADDQLDVVGEVLRALRAIPVDLRREVVQRANLVTVGQKFIGQV